MGIQIVNQMFHHFIFIKQQGPTDKNWHKLVFDVTASRFTNLKKNRKGAVLVN